MERIETARWKPSVNHPSKLEYDGQRTAQEMFEELCYRLANTGYLPDEYFLLDMEWQNGKEFPQNADMFCTTDYGASEGIYTDVHLRIYDEDGRPTIKNFATGKTLGESESDLDRMNLIASAITKAFHSDGVHARYIRLGEAEKSESLVIHLNEDERSLVADSLIEMRNQLVSKTEAVEQLLRRVTGSITEYIDMVGARPLKLSHTDLAVLAIQDGNMAAFGEAFPKADAQDIVFIHAAGRPGRIGQKMTTDMLIKSENSIPNDVYLSACKKAIDIGDADRVLLMMQNAKHHVKDLDMGLYGNAIGHSLEFRNENRDSVRLARAIIKDRTPEQIQAADPSLLLLAQHRGAYEIVFDLVNKGIDANKYAAELFDMLSRQRNAWVINSLVERGMKIDISNYSALHACIGPDTIGAAKSLIGRGMDFDGYLDWAEQNHPAEKDGNLIDTLKAYWENEIKPSISDPEATQQNTQEMSGM